MSADNGGNAGDGGSNFPLRGNKATAWEGGVRGLSWVYGAGLSKSVKGTISHEIMHVTDWLPTLVAGAAGLDLDASGRPCATCNRTVAPLDGVDQWESLTKGKASDPLFPPRHFSELEDFVMMGATDSVILSEGALMQCPLGSAASTPLPPFMHAC